MTLHGLIDSLTEELKLTPEQQFRLTAKIKRLVHFEKASVFQRYSMYSQGAPIFDGEGDNAKLIGHEPPDDKFVHELLVQKAEQHENMAQNFTDEELVTWDVGSHVFRQPPKFCYICSVQVDAITGYQTKYKDQVHTTVCAPCAKENGEWEGDD